MMCPEGLALKKASHEARGTQAAEFAHDKLVAHTHMCELCRRETEKEPEVD
jgi:hypothetical protein